MRLGSGSTGDGAGMTGVGGGSTGDGAGMTDVGGGSAETGICAKFANRLLGGTRGGSMGAR